MPNSINYDYKQWVTLLIFTDNIKLYIVKGLLESEGIACNVKDEMINQVNPFYTPAVGGIKLQISPSDYKRAYAIMKNNGYFEDENNSGFKGLEWIDKLTSKVIGLRSMSLQWRQFTFFTFLIFLSITVFVLLNLPTTKSRFLAHQWCVDKISYNGEKYIPQTSRNNQLIILSGEKCEARLICDKNGRLQLPGFSSPQVIGYWEINKNEQIIIDQTDSFSFVYNGIYTAVFEKNKMILKSNTTTIYSHILF